MDFFPSLPIENLFLMEVVLKYRSPFFDLSNIILQERYAKQTRLRVSFGVEMYDSTSIWEIRLNRISCGLMQRNRIYAIHDRVLHISTPCCRVSWSFVGGVVSVKVFLHIFLSTRRCKQRVPHRRILEVAIVFQSDTKVSL